MDDLKSVWNRLSCDASKMKISSANSIDSIFDKLENEQRLRKKFNPLLIGFILLFTVFLCFIVFQNSSSFTTPKVIGIVCITLASISIAVFSQIIKMPLQQFSHDKSSVVFLNIVKDKLNKTKVMLILGIFLQIVFLSIGLYLIIFYESNDYNMGTFGAFWGFMFGIGGASISGAFAFFTSHYKPTYQLIDQFLKD